MGFFDILWKKKNSVSASSFVAGGKPYNIGDCIGKRYEIYKILGGEGISGMGVVYVCYDHESKKVFALKTFQDKYLLSKEMKDRFKKEALAWIRLERHPYIVRANWVEELDYRLFVTCEFIAPDEHGRNTLTHYLNGLIPLKQALIWSIQFCYGMEHACSKGVTQHRDIKPDNIMITSDRILKITDFGLARLWDKAGIFGEIEEMIEDRKGLSFIKTKKGRVICGSLPWMAPEQFDGIADVRSDIYAFGIVLYQMIYKGEMPFYPKNGDDWEIVHKSYPVLPQQAEGKGISNLFSIIKRCLSKRPDERYGSFKEMREALEGFYRETTGEMPPSPPDKIQLAAWEHLNKGASLANIGLHDEAIKEHKEAIRINPEYAGAHHFLRLVIKGDKSLLDEVIKECKEAIRINPNYAEAYYSLGVALKGKGLLDEAIKEFREAIRINPDYAEAHNSLGIAVNFTGETEVDEVIKEFREAVRINPDYAEAHNNLGMALRDKGLLDEAITEFREGKRINPECVAARNNLELTLLGKSLFDEAIREYRKTLRFNGNEIMLCDYLKYGIDFRVSAIDEDIKKGREAISINSKEAKAHWKLGNVLYRKGLLDEAITEYREAIKISPEDVDAHYLLGFTLYNKGLLDEAIKEYRETIRIAGCASDHFNFGNALRAKGLLDEAIKEFREAIRLRPEYAEAHNNIGSVLRDKGLVDEAIVAFENFIRYASPYYAGFVEVTKGIIEQMKGRIKEK